MLISRVVGYDWTVWMETRVSEGHAQWHRYLIHDSINFAAVAIIDHILVESP